MGERSTRLYALDERSEPASDLEIWDERALIYKMYNKYYNSNLLKA